jgi:hypothetical protein
MVKLHKDLQFKLIQGNKDSMISQANHLDVELEPFLEHFFVSNLGEALGGFWVGYIHVEG